MNQEQLIQQADRSARWRGHRLTWDRYDERRANGECDCGAWASVDTNPPANGIDVGGSAVAVNHPTELERVDMQRQTVYVVRRPRWVQRAMSGRLVSKDLTGMAVLS